ncbi:putative 6-hydroxy-D-nicotine oxidase [Biscogniauxia marginata]|nr:putative 6-hydroxy-D-nicotine oxidase [Biscogniauxia marginata]
MASFLLEPNGIVVGPMDSDYRRLVEINWSKDCWLEPRCIIRPTSATQVQIIMKIINRTSAQFAVRSGGHNPNHGWASIESNGILIDLSLLNQIKVSQDNLTATTGPGNQWIDVYKRLDGSGRTVLGGRTPDVGVGGLLLGGDISSFSSQFGFACDYVPDQETNEDLWWALKGGGSNFGIVTEFELETVPIDGIWYESRIYKPSESRRLLKAVQEYQSAAESDEKASFAFSLSNNHTIVAFIYSQPAAYPAVFNMFYHIPFRQHFIKASFGTLYSLAAARDIIAVSTKPDLSLYERSYDKWLEISEEMLSGFDCMMTFSIQPVTSSAILMSNARGGNTLNLRPESQQWYTSVIQWQDDRFDSLAHEAVVRSGDAVREFAHENGLLLDFEFLNDASWHQTPIEKYGQANLDRLVDISRRYDPLRGFQRLQGRGFILDVMPEK